MTDPADKRLKKTREQRRFESVGTFSDRVTHSTSVFTRLFNRWTSQPKLTNWEEDASWAELQQEPLKARGLLYMAAFTILALIVWAYFAPLDEVTRGQGRVIPSSQLKVLQSLDGGIVKTIDIREGQRVEQGQILMTLDQTRSLADVGELQARILNLRAETVRLRAQINREPPEFSSELKSSAPQLISDQRALYTSNLAELDQQLGSLEEQKIQRRQDLLEAQATLRQSRRVRDLAQQELEATRPLLKSGAVSEVEVLRLEREISQAEGDFKRAQAAIERSQAAIREIENRIQEATLTFQNRWRSELAEVQVRLNSLQQEEAGLADRVQQTQIRSPVNGIVKRIHTNTVGGVVLPGRELIEIVPVEDQLIVEARVSPVDIAFLRPGLPATIKLTAYDFNIFGGLDAEVEHISADTITDEENNTFYLVRLKTQSHESTNDLAIIPGMTAQVDIITGQKTVLEYLLKPVLRATSEAMRER